MILQQVMIVVILKFRFLYQTYQKKEQVKFVMCFDICTYIVFYYSLFLTVWSIHVLLRFNKLCTVEQECSFLYVDCLYFMFPPKCKNNHPCSKVSTKFEPYLNLQLGDLGH